MKPCLRLVVKHLRDVVMCIHVFVSASPLTVCSEGRMEDYVSGIDMRFLCDRNE